MKKNKADKKSEVELLSELKKLMKDKEYDLVDQLLKDNEHLIKGATLRQEVPLVLAIKHWDAQLVRICIDHGADPSQQYKGSQNAKPEDSFLIAVAEFGKKIIKDSSDESYRENFGIYEEIVGHMHRVKKFMASGV